jgi:hypothetical protein
MSGSKQYRSDLPRRRKMMNAGLRVAALFAGYSVIGFSGDYTVGLLAREDADDVVELRHASAVVIEVRPDIVVDIEPAIVSRIQLLRSRACDFQIDRELTIPAAGVNLVRIDAGAGKLHVEGQEGLDEIVVVGVVCASDEEYLEELQVTVEESAGGDVRVVTHYPERRGRGGRNNTATIDLTVLMPLGLNVDIDDSSGEMEVLGTGDLTIDDSSGSIRVSGVDGSLFIDDSSGGLDVQEVTGDVRIEDGSGGIDVRDVDGSVSLRDGSGGIDVAEVARDVVIESDGSGGIAVRDVAGDFIVERDGSGGIRHSGVRGRIDIPIDERRRGGD